MNELPQWISSLPILPAIFVGSFFLGETVVLAGIVLAASGVVNSWTLFGLVLLATLASDLVWFYFGQRLVRLAEHFRPVRERYERTMEAMGRLDDGQRFRYLLFYKFVYGIRIVTIIYVSLRRISLRRFLLFDTIASSGYLLVVIGGGILFYRGASELAPAMHTLPYVGASLVLLFLLLRMGTQWLRKRLFDA